MKLQNIRPIPKAMLRKIERRDKKDHPAQDGRVRWYSYLARYGKELVKVTVAVKNHKKEWFCKQAAVHGLDSERCYVKDMKYSYLGGYTVGWYAEGIQKTERWYEGGWGVSEDKYFDPWAPVINPEYLKEIPEFRYCAYDLYGYSDVLPYLRLYRKHPQIELMVKAGLKHYIDKKMILQKLEKDKAFRKWLYRHAEELKKSFFYVTAVLQAYKKKRPLEEMQALMTAKQAFLHKTQEYRKLKETFKGETDRFLTYLAAQKTSPASYNDYLTACEYLHLDMNEQKNRYPHDFKKWHDIRIDEYRTAKVKEDEQKRKEFYRAFASVANKYLPMQRNGNENFLCLIAKSPAELIREGEALHHCVGRMNYDQKMVREETLIFFIRSKEHPRTPLVTIEYSIEKRQILQCYADHNSTPGKEVMTYIKRKWLPYAKKQLKTLTA